MGSASSKFEACIRKVKEELNASYMVSRNPSEEVSFEKFFRILHVLIDHNGSTV